MRNAGNPCETSAENKPNFQQVDCNNDNTTRNKQIHNSSASKHVVFREKFASGLSKFRVRKTHLAVKWTRETMEFCLI